MKQGWLILTLALLTACSSQPTKTEQAAELEKVVVSQTGDSALNCEQLDEKILAIESEVKEMLKKNEQQSNQAFTASAIADMTMAILAGSANAGNRIDRSALESVNQQHKEYIQSLAHRHNHLMVIAKEKNCAFVVATEARLERYKQQNQRPINQQSYRQRIGTQ